MEVETTEAAFEKDMTNRFASAEIRMRRIAQQDMQAALRGQLADLVAQVERGAESLVQKEVAKQLRPYLEVHERSQQQVRDLVSSNNARVQADRADFTKSIEDTVAGIVLKLLQEYWVLDKNLRVLDANQRP